MSKPVLLFPLHNGTIDTSSFLKLKNKITTITLFEKKVKNNFFLQGICF